jgi:hypothetical protein
MRVTLEKKLSNFQTFKQLIDKRLLSAGTPYAKLQPVSRHIQETKTGST